MRNTHNFADLEEVRTDVNSIPPQQLEGQFLQKAKHGYICPNPACRDGSGKDGTGMTYYPKTNRHYCGKCERTYDNIDIFGFYFDLDPKTQFKELLERIVNKFDLGSFSKVEFRDDDKPVVPDKFKTLILEANANLKKFLDSQGGSWRGLSFDTLNSFQVGFLPRWYARKGAPLTPRVIVPTSFNHYLARLLGNIEDFNVPKDIRLDPKEHRGPKEIFNFKRALLDSDDDICFLVEGEFDCMSCVQAAPEFNCIPILGSDIGNNIATQLKELPHKNFIIFLDDDPAGKKQAPIIKAKLESFGHSALIAGLNFLIDNEDPDGLFHHEPTHFKDANEFLQADPKGLADRLDAVYRNAKKTFAFEKQSRDENNFVPQIEAWQAVNGAINPDALKTLLTDAKKLSSANITPQTPFDSTLINTLASCRFYDFLSNFATDFLARMRDLKNKAKKKVAAFKKLESHSDKSVSLRGDAALKELDDAKPSDDESAFAAFNLAKFEKDINSYTTKIKRAHKAWLAQHEADLENQKIADAKKAHDDNPPTACQFVSDCPVDLVLPQGLFLSQRGISIVDFDKPAKTRTTIEACQNVIVPTCIYREVTFNASEPVNGDQYRIAVKNGSVWRTAVVDAKKLTDAKSVQSLAQIGALISNPNHFAKAMTKLIALNEANGVLPVKKVFTQPGWYGGNFIAPVGNDDYIVKNGDFDYLRTFTPRGDKDAWLDMLAKVIFHDPNAPAADSDFDRQTFINDNIQRGYVNVTAAVTVGAAAGAPLIEPLALRNQQLALGFGSGNGKTALGNFVASIFGNPDTLVATFNATYNYLENLAVKLNGFAHVVDELQAAKKTVRENMDEFLYNFSGGSTRGRADKEGQARKTFRYSGCRIFTGEQNILATNSGQGAIARVFVISYPVLFADSFAVQLHKFPFENFGLFSNPLVDYIAANKDNLVNLFNRSHNSLSESITKDLLPGHATFLAYSLTGLFSLLSATKLAPLESIQQIIVQTCAHTKILADDMPTKETAKNINRALPDLHDFIASCPRFFDHEYTSGSGEQSFYKADANRSYGVVFENGRVAILPVILRKIIGEELGYPNSNTIINELGEAGFFYGPKRKHGNKNYQRQAPKKYAEFVGSKNFYYILRSKDELRSLNEIEEE